MSTGQPMSPRDGHEQLLQVAVPPGERPLGELLRDVCALGDADIARIVALQAERELRFGEAALQLMRLIKHAYDPNNIFNPGKVISWEA